MKLLLAALLFTSFSVLAQELDATAAALNTLPVGNYSGVTATDDQACSVAVSKSTTAVTVTASAGSVSAAYQVKKGTAYRWRPGTRAFLSSYIVEAGGEDYEQVYRTLAVSEDSLYVVIDRPSRNVERKVECIINL